MQPGPEAAPGAAGGESQPSAQGRHRGSAGTIGRAPRAASWSSRSSRRRPSRGFGAGRRWPGGIHAERGRGRCRGVHGRRRRSRRVRGGHRTQVNGRGGNGAEFALRAEPRSGLDQLDRTGRARTGAAADCGHGERAGAGGRPGSLRDRHRQLPTLDAPAGTRRPAAARDPDRPAHCGAGRTGRRRAVSDAGGAACHDRAGRRRRAAACLERRAGGACTVARGLVLESVRRAA